MIKNWFLRSLLGCSIGWAVMIFILCMIPGEDIPDPHLDIPHLDKVVHFGMFFILSVLLCYTLKNKTSLPIKTIFLIVISVAVVYGGLIEILQHYFFNRSGDVYDLSADILGGIAGCPAYTFLKRRFSR